VPAYAILRECNRFPTWAVVTASIWAYVWRARRTRVSACVYGCRSVTHAINPTRVKPMQWLCGRSKRLPNQVGAACDPRSPMDASIPQTERARTERRASQCIICMGMRTRRSAFSHDTYPSSFGAAARL